MVIAEACERLGAGCQERNLASGRVAIDFWVDGDPKEASDTLAAVLRGVGAENSVETAEQSDDWKDALKRHHQPVTIGGRLYLRPPWVSPPRWVSRCRYRPRNGVWHRPARNDPGMFGASDAGSRRRSPP